MSPVPLSRLTHEVAAFSANLRWDDIPAAARGMVGSGFADAVAAMLASRDEPAVRVLTEVLLGPPTLHKAAALGARLMLSRRRARPGDAALINGTAMHAQDFDDIGLGAHPAHPSAVLVPALLALADVQPCDGQALITAYIAGYEVWGELALREPDQYHVKGWHPTGVFGALAAAAACARLLRLSSAHAVHAMAIAASQARGVVANFGSMTKPMHAGQAAQAGVLSAQLAQAGYTGGGEALEHPRGLLRALSPQGRVDLHSPCRLGSRWHSVELPLGFKQFPVCYAMHRAVDAAIELHGQLGEDSLRQIETIQVRIGCDQAAMLIHPDPSSPIQAKFSLPFAVAVGLRCGKLGLAELGPDTLRSSAVRELMGRVLVTTTQERDLDYRLFAPCDRVEVHCRDGRRRAAEVRHAPGHPLRPLTEAAHARKFADCAAGAFDSAAARACFDALWLLQRLPAAAALPFANEPSWAEAGTAR